MDYHGEEGDRILIESNGFCGLTHIRAPEDRKIYATRVVWELDAREDFAYVRIECVAPVIRVAGRLRPQWLLQRVIQALRYIIKGRMWL